MKEQDEDINNELEKLKAEAYSLRKRVSELMMERARLQTIYKAQQSEIQALREREQQRRQD
jgi:predicted  nucleic acid-binding Zn-ribbon protein